MKVVNFICDGIGLGPIWDKLLGSDKFTLGHNKWLNKAALDDILMFQIIITVKPKYKNEQQAIDQTYRSDGNILKKIGEHYGKHQTTISLIVKSVEMRFGKASSLWPLACCYKLYY
jgi:hypothetical protein